MIAFADLFCGAGGATTGVLKAADRRKIPIRYGVAINHWETAVETHSANHPKVKHMCEAIERVDPCVAVPGGRLDILWASPECTHHSRARGGKPRQNQSRAGASHILTWLDKLYVRNVIIENVPEFQDWGPLTADGQPIKSKVGQSFRAFIESLKARNYNVDYRILNAADYGDATTRQRLFIIARRKPLPIVWPEPTHRPLEECEDLFGKSKPWRPARDIIDWTDLGDALSQRPMKKFVVYHCDTCDREWSKPLGRKKKRPGHAKCRCKKRVKGEVIESVLSPNTMRRIIAGLEKFCGMSFVMDTGGRGYNHEPMSTESPVRTILTRNHKTLITPVVGEKEVDHSRFLCQKCKTEFGVNDYESNTVTCPKCGNQSIHTIVDRWQDSPDTFVLGQQSGSKPRPVSKPIPTIAAGGAISMVTAKLGQSFLIQTDQTGSNGKCVSKVDEPLPTTVTKQNRALVTVKKGDGFLVSLAHGNKTNDDNKRRAKSVADPMPSLTTKGQFALCRPFLVNFRGTKKEQLDASAADTDQPISTLSTKDHHGLVQPFLVRIRGTKKSHVANSATSADEPVPTISTNGHHHYLAQPFITKYYGNENGAQSVEDPLDAVTTKDRFLLVNPSTNEAHQLEIYFRLLKPGELAAAHSFPDDYKFKGNKTAVVKQIGNSNPVELTAALTSCVL